MKTITEAAIEADNKLITKLTDKEIEAMSPSDNYILGFNNGCDFIQTWIDANIELPTKDELVLIKLTKAAWTLNKYSVAYLDSSYPNKNVWILENRHCTHHTEAVNNIITHWRPIERI